MSKPTIRYPETNRVEVVDHHFGHEIKDPYRWLENDARTDNAVSAWVAAQNEVTRGYLDTLDAREVFRRRLTALFDHERVTVPHKRGGRYFYSGNSGLQNQASLRMRDSVNGADRVLIDPNAWSVDGTIALAQWEVSQDGTHVAYAVQQSGSDWHTIRVMNVATGEVLPEEVEWSRFSTISWAVDGSGFFYARYPEQGITSQAGIANHAIYFHALGTEQSQDRLLYASPDQPHLVHFLAVTEDGRYGVIASTPGTMTHALTVVDLADPEWKPRTLISHFDEVWSLIGNEGSKLFFSTSLQAERFKISMWDIGQGGMGDGEAPCITDIVPEQDAVLSDAWMVGGRLLASYLVDAKTEIRCYSLDGRPEGEVRLPGIGTAGGVRGRQDDHEAFYGFTSFNAPTTIFRYDVATQLSTVWAEPSVDLNVDAIVVEQRFYASRDGTEVPMFIVRRKDVTGPAPTMLYAYGGFSISIIPGYSPAQLAWVEQGGVLAVANIRGGGEYGQAWHYAGRLKKKQNVFDDFIAAAAYLKTEKITTVNGLAIQGESNGGLLVGAVVNQCPDLFDVALPGVGVMDMLRFDQFTGGKLWSGEFGDPAQESDFRNLLAYSPYHNVQPGKPYPAILATTADTDDRVVPGHTFKYVAALQAADLGTKPRLVRIETRAGHGAGKPIAKVIEETADMWAFAAHWTGLDVNIKG